MKEIGVGMAARMMAKALKPRLVISENGGKWTLRSENSVKTMSFEFIPMWSSMKQDQMGAKSKSVYISLSRIILFLYSLFSLDVLDNRSIQRRCVGTHRT